MHHPPYTVLRELRRTKHEMLVPVVTYPADDGHPDLDAPLIAAHYLRHLPPGAEPEWATVKQRRGVLITRNGFVRAYCHVVEESALQGFTEYDREHFLAQEREIRERAERDAWMAGGQ
jgi:hypothetical protein